MFRSAPMVFETPIGQPLATDMQTAHIECLTQLTQLTDLAFDDQIILGRIPLTAINFELHAFTDASKIALAGCVNGKISHDDYVIYTCLIDFAPTKAQINLQMELSGDMLTDPLLRICIGLPQRS